MKADPSDSVEAMRDDKKFSARQRRCATKKAEWDIRCETRIEELQAPSATIKVLTDENLLGDFEKTLRSSSSLQTQEAINEVRKQ